MGLYIQDDKTKTIRHYHTSPKVEKAIETLLKQDEEMIWSESLEGYEVTYRYTGEKKSEG